jgi:CysZ protein
MSESNAVGSAASAAALHLEGARLLLREGSLRRLAWTPVLIALACFALAFGLVVAYAAPLYAFAAGWLPTPEAAVWYAWLWIGPARLLLALLGIALFLLLVAGSFATTFVIASVIAAPFHDALSLRVETIIAGAASEASGGGVRALLREATRAALEELRRALFFGAVMLSILLLGIAVPGGQLLAPPAMALFCVLFLPLDYAGYALDRRRLTFRDKRRWVTSHAPAMLGFGGPAFAICLLPGLNLLAMPVFVVAATLLVLKTAPERSRRCDGG